MRINRFISSIKEKWVVVPSLQHARTRLLRGMIAAFAILGFPAMLAGSIEAFAQGHPGTSWQYLGIYLPVLLAALFPHFLPFHWQSFILLGALYTLAFSNLLIYGFSGAGIHVLLTICVLATMLLGWRVGMSSILMSMLAIIVAGLALSLGYVEIDPDLTHTSVSLIAWATALLTFLMLSAAMVVTAGLVQAFMQRSINDLQMYQNQLEGLVEDRTQELRDTQQRLIRQERLAVLGQLAGGVAHELRNPLGVISNAIYYLKMVLPKADDATNESLGLIETNTQEAARIVSDLLDFGRNQSVERVPAKVSEIVSNAIAQYPAPKNVSIRYETPEVLPPVLVDPLQITQVLNNLFANACQAMPEGGKLTIKAENGKGFVSLSVSDTGVGIPPENMDQVFEPLFTTKARGIGLGLAISQKFVEANHGSIEVESIAGEGSTFTVKLPVD